MSKQLRLAFSGSGFRLPAFCGVLSAIEEAGWDIVELAGTSGGSICAALYASGMNADQMTHMAISQDWSKMLTFDPFRGVIHGGYCSGDVLEEFLLEHTKNKTFADIEVDLKIVASDLVTESEVIFSKATTPNMPIGLAARASASIPFVYVPVSYKNWLLVDGGCCNNIPVDRLVVDGIPRFGVYLVSSDSPLAPGSYGPSTIAERVIDLMLASNEDAHVADAAATGAKIIHIDTSYAGSLDRHMLSTTRIRLIADGRAAMQQALKT